MEKGFQALPSFFFFSLCGQKHDPKAGARGAKHRQGERESRAPAGAKLFRGIPDSTRGPSVSTTISCTLLTNAPGAVAGTKALHSLCHPQTRPHPPRTALQGAEEFSKAFGEAPPAPPGSQGTGINWEGSSSQRTLWKRNLNKSTQNFREAGTWGRSREASQAKPRCLTHQFLSP